MNATYQEIAEAVQPLVNILEKEGNPHIKIIVDLDNVEVLEGSLGFPLHHGDN